MTKFVCCGCKIVIECQKFGYFKHNAKITKHTKMPLTLTNTPTKPFVTVIVDTIGPLPKSYNGNSYAVTIICDMKRNLF